jgi:hypothetical protein
MGDTQGWQPPSDVRAGYLTPEEEARRQSQDNQTDRGMNMGSIRILQQREAADKAANAAATVGGFKMDVETMKSLLPKWQSIADKLEDLRSQGGRFLYLHKTADDQGSIFQKKAADAHADVYQASVICHWSDDVDNSVAVSLVRGNGLRDVYQSQDSERGYFVPVPELSGYPALFASLSDCRSEGTCTMGVGVRNDEVMIVDSSFVSSSPYYSDPCSLTQKAAEAAITTLKGAS